MYPITEKSEESMKRLTALTVAGLVIVAMFATTAPLNAQQTKHYLTLGGDPEAKNRQPEPDEEVFVSDVDLCDSGWGTGSGARVEGCYRVGVAGIRKKITKIVTAIYFCGNTPADMHIGIGKAVPVEVATRIVIQQQSEETAFVDLNKTMDRIARDMGRSEPKPIVLESNNAYFQTWDDHPFWMFLAHSAAAVVADCGFKLAPCHRDKPKGPNVGTDKPTFP
jgi:hypothetical protein